jgi:hypothetical protein
MRNRNKRVLPFAFLGDDVGFRIEVAPPKDAVAQRLQDEALKHVSVLGLRPQEPGVKFRLIHIHRDTIFIGVPSPARDRRSRLGGGARA